MLHSQTFLQIVLIANSYWFTYECTTYIIFLRSNNHLLPQKFIKKVCNSSNFLILVTIKKFIDGKYKTKYTSQKKKKAQQQKLPIVKLKRKKLNQPILSKINNHTL